jgi:hypothetical protein
MFEYSAHRRMGRKKLGGQKEICPTFSHCARLVVKKIFRAISKIVVGGDDEDTKN